MISNQKINDYMKEIGAMCGINKKLTFQLCKSQRFFFLAKIQALANFRSLIGNDLETSEILYFTSFCSNSKERFS